MNERKSNKVIGILGIEAMASNFNGDFTGSPKKHMGEFVSSPFAIKYPIRKQWHNQGHRVLSIKSYNASKSEEGAIPPSELGERYTSLFGEEITKKTNGKDVIKNLLSCIDVINFGTAFAVKEANTQIAGVVQFNEGINKYEEAETVRDVVSSPFKNSNNETAKASTMGQRSVVTEAHYFYNFTVNPLNLKPFSDIDLGHYTDEAYKHFKQGCLSAVTNLNTVAKAGCTNEFAMFIELEEDCHNLLNNLNYRVKFYKEDGKNVIDLSDIVGDIVDINESIKLIEIFFNPNSTIVKFPTDSTKLIEKITSKNINRQSKDISINYELSSIEPDNK